jgi:hypothetical protein
MVRRIDRAGIFSKDRSRAYYQRLEAIAKLKVLNGMTEAEARTHLRAENKRAKEKPWPFERCAAKTRTGSRCRARALTNGRCRCHGGLSTGPRTPEGMAKALSKLRQNRKP